MNILKTLFNRKSTADTQPDVMPGIAQSIQSTLQGAPALRNVGTPKQRVAEIEAHLIEFAMQLPIVQNIPPHPVYGVEPIRLAIRSEARSIALSAVTGMELYMQAGGVTGLACEADGSGLMVAFMGYSSRAESEDVRQAVSLTAMLANAISEDDQELSELFTFSLHSFARQLSDGTTDFEDVFETIAHATLSSPRGQILIALPFLTLPYGAEASIPQLREVFGALLGRLGDPQEVFASAMKA